MSTPRTDDVVAAPRPARGRPEAWPRALRWLGGVLLLGWCVVTALAVLGERPAAYEEFAAAARAGQVDDITVHGGLPDPEARGSNEATLVWRSGWRTHETLLIEARPSGTVRAEDPDVRITSDVMAELYRLAPGVPTVRTDRPASQGGVHATVLGAEVHGWGAGVFVVVLLGTLGLVVAGPQPHRATRWAWGWLLLLPLGVGPALYLLGSGATLPGGGRGRLTGGWAFVILVLAGAASAA